MHIPLLYHAISIAGYTGFFISSSEVLIQNSTATIRVQLHVILQYGNYVMLIKKLWKFVKHHRLLSGNVKLFPEWSVYLETFRLIAVGVIILHENYHLTTIIVNYFLF